MVNATNVTTVAPAAAVVFDSGDTAFILVSTALVMIMIPGLAFFYAGMVHRKNVVATLYQSMITLGVVMVQWWFWGYSLTFAEGGSVFIGNLNYIMLINPSLLTTAHPNAPTIPHLVWFIYQSMFAVITPALISGAVVERLRFRTYCVFLFLWSTLVYNFVAHWVWSPDGWLYKLGILDLAGGFAVHMTAGISAFALAICMKTRLGYHSVTQDAVAAVRHKFKPKQPEAQPENSLPPSRGSRYAIAQAHNIPLIVIGTGLLWFGWLGFNGGSALKANAWAGLIFVNTNISGAFGGIIWICYDWIFRGKPTLVGFCCGCVCGLASVTPAAGYIYPGIAGLLGATSSFIIWPFVRLKAKFIDDSLDAFAAHGIGGLYGCFFVGIFAAKYSFNATSGNSPIAGGWWDGNFIQLAIQLAGIGAVGAWSFVITIILFLALNWIPGLGWNVSELDQIQGTDISEHGEIGYIMCHENDFESETLEKEKRGGIVYLAKKLKSKLLHEEEEKDSSASSPTSNAEPIKEQEMKEQGTQSGEHGTELQTIDVQVSNSPNA